MDLIFSEKWIMRFLGAAIYYSSFSKDPSTKVGCVLVNDKLIPVGFGYNGFSRHNPDKEEYLNDRDKKYPRTIHAEENAIYNANSSVDHTTAFLTHPPCVSCVNRLSQNGIKKVYFISPPPSFGSRWNIGESEKEMKELGMDYQMVKFDDTLFYAALIQEAKILSQPTNNIEIDFDDQTVTRS